MAAADTKKEAEEAEKITSGELLFCGSVDWHAMGRKRASPAGNIVSPTRLRSLVGIDIRFVAAGCSSCHCVALDVEGRCYTWGRNEKGQLGHGDTLQRNIPTVVSALLEYKIVKAGAGKNHTVVVTEDGRSLSFGLNKQGQLGTGSTRNEIEPYPVPCSVSQVTNAVCGAMFTVWLSSVEGSSILTAGHPQYGQLGHGTDNEYNAKEASVKLEYEAQPDPQAIATFSEKKIVKVACGINHTVAVDSSGFVYTWGCGGYGRLGHRVQKDEWAPRLVEVFQRHNVLPPNAVVSASSFCSACTAGRGLLYMWGKTKNKGDASMYPKPVMDLSGWNIHCMDSGNLHHFVGADDSCISWGQAQYGELGYGPMGQTSSATPKKVDILDGMHVISVACGLGFSLVVVDRTKAIDRLDELEVYDGEPLVEAAGTDAKVNETVKPTKNTNKKVAEAGTDAKVNETVKPTKDTNKKVAEAGTDAKVNETVKPTKNTNKKVAAAGTDAKVNETVKPTKNTNKKGAGNSSRKRKKDSSESEDEGYESSEDEEEDEIEDTETKGRRGGKASNRGRGRGAKKVASEVKSTGGRRGRPPKSAEAKSSGRGRGRPRKGRSGR